jgi:hypothetical protein
MSNNPLINKEGDKSVRNLYLKSDADANANEKIISHLFISKFTLI